MVADVIGHGVSGALYTMWLKSLSESLSNLSDSPADFMIAMNHELSRFVVNEGFATAFYGVIDTERWELTYTNAGHPRPLLFHADKSHLQEMELHGIPLGVSGAAKYGASTAVLHPGDLVLCYTDGVTEAVDRQDQMLGEEGLVAMIKECISNTDKDLLEQIYLTIKESCGNVALEDDVTLLSVERIV
jgi:sigma-B regulation protein RsbU (phosphoserine phosphatase)